MAIRYFVRVINMGLFKYNMVLNNLDSEEIRELVEDVTNQEWEVVVDEDDKISLITEIWKFDIVRTGSGWIFELYDASDGRYDDDEPKWADGAYRNSTEVTNAIPDFIPMEVRV